MSSDFLEKDDSFVAIKEGTLNPLTLRALPLVIKSKDDKSKVKYCQVRPLIIEDWSSSSE